MAGTDDYSTHKLSHIVIDNFQEKTLYIAPRRNIQPKPLRPDFVVHAQGLLNQLSDALGNVPAAGYDQRITLGGLQAGTIVKLETQPLPENSRSIASKLSKALEFPARDLTILRSERRDNGTESAFYFIPDGQRDNLTERVRAYGRRSNQENTEAVRFQNIETISSVNARDLFIGDTDFNVPELAWWEAWVRTGNGRAEALAQAARNADFDVFADRLEFPDTIIIFIRGVASDLAEFLDRVPGAVSEIRRATDTIQTFLDLQGHEIGQRHFIDDLLERITLPDGNAPAVCLLDTGVAAAHPLLSAGLAGVWAYDDAWGTDDHQPNGGHGTAMVGLALYGDLHFPMSDTRKVELNHVAESMKILPPKGFPPTEPARYGTITQGAVGKVEISASDRPRAYCLAVTSHVTIPDRPSSWSGAIDQVCAGAMPGDQGDEYAADLPKRLVLIATGNVVEGTLASVMEDTPLEDPAQAWNALTIGGYTAKDILTPPTNLQVVAGANDVSPYSRTSVQLPSDLTPIKPEVLFEAGNMVFDDTHMCSWHPEVSLLSTGADIENEPLVPFWATSAATGVAGRFFGQLQAALPGLWPETYRALAVQSADWPQPIRKLLIGRGVSWKSGAKGLKQKIIRRVGYGVPNISRAIMSAKNDVTLIAQQEIQPFTENDHGNGAVYNEMHFYPLPWPKEALEALDNAPVMLKVTLSYFPEPNLSGKAATRPETYRAYGLRFAIKKRLESQQAFRARLTASQEKEVDAVSDTEASRWLLGMKSVSAGSLHCDIWRGPAIELAAHDEIGVFPVGGWWKSHFGQRRSKDKGRYALVLSITAPGQSVDLYSEIENLVATKEIGILIG